MAGGIYIDQPFYLNPKCILFGGGLMSGYWLLPPKNIYILPLLFVIAYIAMAWYDHVYKCNTPLYSGTGYGISVIDSIFKPQQQDEKQPKPQQQDEKQPKNIAKDQAAIYKRNVYLFHLIVIAPLLAYVGIVGKRADVRIFPVLAGIGLLAGVYHGYRLITTSTML